MQLFEAILRGPPAGVNPTRVRGGFDQGGRQPNPHHGDDSGDSGRGNNNGTQVIDESGESGHRQRQGGIRSWRRQARTPEERPATTAEGRSSRATTRGGATGVIDGDGDSSLTDKPHSPTALTNRQTGAVARRGATAVASAGEAGRGRGPPQAGRTRAARTSATATATIRRQHPPRSSGRGRDEN